MSSTRVYRVYKARQPEAANRFDDRTENMRIVRKWRDPNESRTSLIFLK